MFELPAALAAAGDHRALCDDNAPLCTERSDLNCGVKNYEGRYVGHDEPSVLFYSNVPGSGNSSVYRLRLPKDPPRLPTQDGSGGTFNFQLRPAFWFGMAMCDSQSFPNPGQPCTPDSDANIFDSANPAAADYIGKHPGTAFMEMRSILPVVLWPAGNSCDPLKWCAALNIDSLQRTQTRERISTPRVKREGDRICQLRIHHQERGSSRAGKSRRCDAGHVYGQSGNGPVHEFG